MAEAALSVRTIGAKYGLRRPLSVRTDVLGYGGRNNRSLRDALARMQSRFVTDAKYCNPARLDAFDVHFVVIARTRDANGNPYVDAAGVPIRVPTATNVLVDPAGGSLAGAAVFRREIDILNQFFRQEDGSQVSTRTTAGEQKVRFRYKSHHYLEDVEATGEDLVEYGRQEDWQRLCQGTYPQYYGSAPGCFIDDIWACADRRLYDPLAINIFIFDNVVPDCSAHTIDPLDNCSYGNLNRQPGSPDRYRPYVLLDWERLFHNHLSPEEHEMGHAFGLNHNLNPAEQSGDSNIMQGRPMRAGRRNKGFGVIQHEKDHVGQDYDQVATIIDNAFKLQRWWGEVYRSRWP